MYGVSVTSLSAMSNLCWVYMLVTFFVFQAEDGIRDLVRSRGLGDVYKRHSAIRALPCPSEAWVVAASRRTASCRGAERPERNACLLYTSDAADERSSVDLGGRRIIKKKNR